jgi:predicted nuclease with TOPRIM domain
MTTQLSASGDQTEKMKSLSQKTEKLVVTSSLISETLNRMESPGQQLGETDRVPRNASSTLDNTVKKSFLGLHSTPITETPSIVPSNQVISDAHNSKTGSSYKAMSRKNESPVRKKVDHRHITHIHISDGSSLPLTPKIEYAKTVGRNSEPDPINRNSAKQVEKHGPDSQDKESQPLSHSLDHVKSSASNSNQYHLEKETNIVNRVSENLNQADIVLASSPALKTQSQTIAHLQQTIEALKSQNRELNIKQSKTNIELKSLMEQNDILRRENRKLQEHESDLRQANLKLQVVQTDPYTKLESCDQVELERVLAQLNDLQGKVNVQLSYWQNSNTDPERIQNIKLCSSVLSTLSRFSEKLPKSLGAKTILGFCSEISGYLSALVSISIELIGGTKLLDDRILKLQQEIKLLGNEAAKTLNETNVKHEKEKALLGTELSDLKQDLVQLANQYKQVLGENGRLIADLDNLEYENQELKNVIREANVPSEVVFLANSGESQARKAEREDYAVELTRMKKHIEQLNAALGKWKEEFERVDGQVESLKKQNQKLESERLLNCKLISELKCQVKDEIMKNQKATELIKSLQVSSKVQDEKVLPSASVDSQMPFSGVKTANTSVIADLMLAEPNSAESNVLKHLQSTEEKIQLIRSLSQELEGKRN